MTPEAIATLAVASIGTTVSWAVWVSVSVFKHAQELALIKQEIKLIIEVKEVLDAIKMEMRIKNGQPKK